MPQDTINSEFSGQIASLQLQMADQMQQLLFRPTQTTYSEGLGSLQQSIEDINSSLNDALSKWNTLQRLFIDFKYTENVRFAYFTGFTGIDYKNLSGLVTGLYSSFTGFTGLIFPALTGQLSGNFALFTGHTGSNPRTAHPPTQLYTNYATGNYSIGPFDDIVLFSGLSTAGTTGTLPDATALSGRTYSFVRTDSNPTEVMLTGQSILQTINGSTSILFPSQYTGLTITSDGARWLKIP